MGTQPIVMEGAGGFEGSARERYNQRKLFYLVIVFVTHKSTVLLKIVVYVNTSPVHASYVAYFKV